MFYCADSMNLSGDRYYGAYHPQTILAYEMNERALPIAHGAPLRLRDERQLGYKMAKYIMRIELVADFRAHWRRQRRLLGRPGVRTVGRYLITRFSPPAAA
jgi:DMSO/TMAO reductase YedYZ molybdopterin-dependent catalytic subunit